MNNLNTNNDNNEVKSWSTNKAPLNYNKGRQSASSNSKDGIDYGNTSTNSTRVQSAYAEETNDKETKESSHYEQKDNPIKSKMLLVIAVLIGVGIGAMLMTMNNNNKERNTTGIETESAYVPTVSENSSSTSDYSESVDSVVQAEEEQGLTDTINGYISNGDYEAAIAFINSNFNDMEWTPEIDELYNSAIVGFREQVINDADEALSDNRYEDAFLIVYNGLDVLPDDPILKEELERCSDYMPVDLASIVPYYEGYIDVFTQGATDTLGNHYYTGIRGYMSPSDSNCYNIWDIGGKYDVLTATGIILESDKGSSYEGSYRIYGDGRLLYERTHIGSQTKPYNIEVDITGVTDLKIEMFGEGNITMLGIDSVLVDVRLQKRN